MTFWGRVRPADPSQTAASLPSNPNHGPPGPIFPVHAPPPDPILAFFFQIE